MLIIMIVVISIGGSVIAPKLDFERFEEYAEVIKEIAKERTVFVVVGGGAAAREYIHVARKLGANETVCDFIGIDVTRLNARLLISALGGDAHPEPPSDYKEAENVASWGKIIAMGGVIPGQTTDAVAAILAEYVQADLLVNATCVDGVYTANPDSDPEAKKLDKVTPEQLVKIVMKTETKAGARSVLDLTAAKIIERSNITTVVLNGADPKNIIDVVLRNKHVGTEIRPSCKK